MPDQALTTQRFDDVRVMWKSAVAMYLVGAATLFAVLPLPDPDPSDHTALAIVGVVMLVLGLGFWAAGPRRKLLRLTAVLGIIVVSILCAVATPIAAAPFFYLWPMLLAGYYLTPRELNGAIVLMIVGFGIALLVSPEPQVKTVLFIGGSPSFALAALVVNRLRQRLNRVFHELERSAESDPLTGLLNRRGFERAFDRDLQRAHRTGTPLALLLFDLDEFKQVNDRFGHAIGDEALQTVSRILLDERRGGDPVARTGGEEFAVVLADSDLDGALAYAQRVAAAARDADGPAGPLGLSVGIVQTGGEPVSCRDLMLDADRLLYAAKAAGRGRAAVQGEPVRMEPLAGLTCLV